MKRLTLAILAVALSASTAHAEEQTATDHILSQYYPAQAQEDDFAPYLKEMNKYKDKVVAAMEMYEDVEKREKEHKATQREVDLFDGTLSLIMGNPYRKSTRSCHPEEKYCTTSVVAKIKDIGIVQATMVSDADDHVTGRSVCALNDSMDIKKCYDIDAGIRYSMMREKIGMNYKIISFEHVDK
jgi:hypothetical protein